MLNRKQRRIIFISVLIIITGLAYYLFYYTRQNPGDYGEVSAELAKKLIEKGPDLIILDVRTQSEYESGHIEKAILIPLAELPSRLNELNPEDELLVYCRTGNRSSQAVEILEANGFEKIYHLANGISEWTNSGYPVVQ